MKIIHRGKESTVLLYGNNTYSKSGGTQEKKIYWRCSSQKRTNCNALIHTANDMIVYAREEHNH